MTDLSNNQTVLVVASGRGGHRDGAGRKPGSLNKRSSEIADELARAKCDPARGLAEIAKEARASGDRQLAATCYKELLPFVYPKLKMSDKSVTFDANGLAERLAAARQRLAKEHPAGGVIATIGADGVVAEVATNILRAPNEIANSHTEPTQGMAAPRPTMLNTAAPLHEAREATNKDEPAASPMAPRVSWRAKAPVDRPDTSGSIRAEYDPYQE
jgi:hypothetical protein